MRTLTANIITTQIRGKVACLLMCMILFFIGCRDGYSQEEFSVEKSVFGIQLSLIGLHVHHEARLSGSVSLRTEAGLHVGLFQTPQLSGTGFILAPSLAVEPRWYYNLEKRGRKLKRIDGNSANFLSLQFIYFDDAFTISNATQANVIPSVTSILYWGMRRNIGKHFNFEFGAGPGYTLYIYSVDRILYKSSRYQIYIHLRFGFRL